LCGIFCTPEPPAPKGVPEQVATHPMWFITLTGPGFGAVHGAACGRGRGGRSASGGRTGRAGDVCAHGRGRACDRTHHDDDPELGEPICPDCYDYLAAVAFNWRAPELWRRFTIALRRRLAAQLGMSEAALGRTLRVSYAKVAEFQTPWNGAFPRDHPHRRCRRRLERAVANSNSPLRAEVDRQRVTGSGSATAAGELTDRRDLDAPTLWAAPTEQSAPSGAAQTTRR